MGWLVVVVGLIVAGVLLIMYSSRYHQLHVWKKCFMCGASGYVRRSDLEPQCPRCDAAL